MTAACAWEDTTTFYILHFSLCTCSSVCVLCFACDICFFSYFCAYMKSHFLVDFFIIIPSLPPPYDDALITSAITPAD